MENITAKIEKKTRKVYLSRSIIGNDGENLQEKLVFSFNDEFVNGTARLELNRNNTKSYIMLTKVNNTYELPVKSLITKVGKLDLQLVITEGTNENEIPIFKSNVFFVIVNPSINAEIEQPEEYPQWIDVANAKINLIDEKLEDIDDAITEANNLDLDVSKSGKVATVTLTKKDTTTKSVTLSDGTSLQFQWSGTSLGIKTDNDSEYTYVDLQGVQGPIGPKGEAFTIKKTYTSVAEMNADFDNMQLGDYVMIASTVEVEDNAKLYTRGESQWIFISDFSGAQGIRGETGLTPNIQIGNVVTGQTSSVTRTGTNENPILNFVLEKGETGATGQTGATGATGNGIASITKTGTSGLVDTYTITYTNGTTSTFEITNGEDGEVTLTQFNKLKQRVEDLETNQSTDTKTGTDIEINDAHEMNVAELKLSKESTQDGTPSPSNPQTINTVTGDVIVKVIGKNLFDGQIERGGISPSSGELVVDNNRTRSKNFIKVKPNTTYTILRQSGLNRWIIGYKLDKTGITDGETDYASSLRHFGSAASSATFTTTSTTEYIKWYDTASDDLHENVMIELGENSTPTYEPYTETTVTIPLNDNEIAEIDNYKDEIVIDINGHCWLRKVMQETILTGNETDWTLNSVGSSGKRYWRGTFKSGIKDVGLCNYAILGEYDNRNENTYITDKFYVNTSSLQFRKDDISSLDDFKAWLQNLYNNNNPVKVLSVRQTPQLIDLQQDVDLRLFNGINEITNNKTADMVIKYVVNIDNVLNNKQDLLVSGTNLKTINNISLLGSGNIDIQGGGGGYAPTIDGEKMVFTNDVRVEGEELIF